MDTTSYNQGQSRTGLSVVRTIKSYIRSKMGACVSTPEERHSQAIDRQLREEAKRSKTCIKILLLGT
jgi:hypothetical protein